MDWFKRHTDIPAGGIIVHSWDTAYKKGAHNDPSVCLVWVIHGNTYYLRECYVGKWEYPELKRRMLALADEQKPDAILIEDKASGQSLLQELRDFTAHPVVPISPEADKETRARTTAIMVESGRCSLPKEAHWLGEYERALALCPNGAWDIVDATSQFLKWARGRDVGIIKRDQWMLYDPTPLEFPRFKYMMGSLYAPLVKGGLTGFTVWGVWNDEDGRPQLMLVNAWEHRLALQGLSDNIHQQDQWGVLEWIEHMGAKHNIKRLIVDADAAGEAACREMRKLLWSERYKLDFIYPDSDPVSRMHAVQHIFAAGMVHAPNRRYARLAIDRISSYPRNTAEESIPCSTSLALQWLRKSNWAQRTSEHEAAVIQSQIYRRPLPPIYDI